MIRTATSHAAHLLMEAVLGAVALLALIGCVLVWRLAQGPIDITTLVQREQHRLPSGGVRVTIGGAALAWEGFRDPDSPIDIRFSDLRLADANGAALAQLPAGRVTLAAAPLWRGTLLPRTIVLDQATVILHRDADGVLRLDLGQDQPAPGSGSATSLLTALTNPGSIPVLADLDLVRLGHAAVTLRDAALGVAWHANTEDLVLRRHPDRSLTADATLDLAVGNAHTRLTSHVRLDAAGLRLVVGSFVPVSPATVARAVPGLAALAAVDAPLTAALAANFDAGFRLRGATLSLQAGAGTIHAGRGHVAIAAASAVLETDGTNATLRDVRIGLRPPAAAQGPGPLITGRATARRAGMGWQTDFAVAIDRAPFADLPAYWPAGTGGGSQSWVTQNITAGVAQNAHVAGTLQAAADGTGLTLTALSGGIDAHDMTLHWLRPVPPIEHAEAHLTIDGPDVLHIDVPRGAQGALALSGGSIRITGLAAKDQFGTIQTVVDGALPDVLALLNHPRLRLLSRRPIPLNNPAGKTVTHLTVKLPLAAGVTFDDIFIGATAKLTDVHLGAIAAGRDLDRGNLDLAVDTNQLTLRGDGDVAHIPAQLGLFMDFRRGPPDQVLERLTATGTATAAQIAAALPHAATFSDGTTGFDISYAALRDSSGSVAVNLDLSAAALVTPLGWAKPAGQPAHAAARLALRGDHLVGIDRISADGPGLRLISHMESLSDRPAVLVLDKAILGRTNLHGRIAFPGTADPRWRVNLRGPALDLSTYLQQRDTSDTASADDDTPGPPWQADVAFDQVVLARDEALAPVTFRAESDGLHLTQLDLSAGPAGQVRASITRHPGGRTLSIKAEDAGAVLLAAGVANNVRGGRLRLDATYDDTAPHAPLNGTASLDSFRITDAPVIGRLLKTMTLYGAVDLLRGPGLGFQKAEANFRWLQHVLHLNTSRAFSASLGLTAQGDIDLGHHTANLTGTIVPAYFFNHLLGDIPVLGKIFSPEAGSGVFAASYQVRGKLADPKIGINPLAALTPGFLRGVFGLL
jgi:hypothetical protein